jgi:phosphatidyl-myo-inositol dimannoside synthase
MTPTIPPRLLCVFPGMSGGSGGIQLSGQIAWRGLTDYLRSRHERAELFVFGELAADDASRGGAAVAVVRRKWQAPWSALSRRWQAPVVCFWHVGLLRLLPFLRMPRARVVLILNGIEVWRPFGFWMRRLLRRVDLFVSISRYTWTQFLRWHPELADRPHQVVYLGLDAPLTEPPPPPAPPPAALILGRMMRSEDYKGHRELISVWPRVRQRWPDAELWIAGSGDLQPDLEQLAKQQGVAGHVRFLGRVSEADKQALLQRCRCLAMPSRGEGFGLVYLEAMRLGRPCLVSDSDAGCEVVQPPEAGLAVHPADADVLTDALVRLLSPGDEWQRWSENGRRRYEAHFTARQYQERLVRALLGD